MIEVIRKNLTRIKPLNRLTRLPGGETGTVLVLVLLISLLLVFVFLDMIQAAYMERLMSRNNLEVLQAHQAADAGIAWACEEIYGCLVNQAGQERLPRQPVVEACAIPQVTGENDLPASFRLLSPGVLLIDSKGDYCVYEFTCEGQCRRARCPVTARIKYEFENYYGTDADGNLHYINRTFSDRGKVASYILKAY